MVEDVQVLRHVVPLSVPPSGHVYAEDVPPVVTDCVTAAHQLLAFLTQKETPKPALSLPLLVALNDPSDF